MWKNIDRLLLTELYLIEKDDVNFSNFPITRLVYSFFRFARFNLFDILYYNLVFMFTSEIIIKTKQAKDNLKDGLFHGPQTETTINK